MKKKQTKEKTKRKIAKEEENEKDGKYEIE